MGCHIGMCVPSKQPNACGKSNRFSKRDMRSLISSTFLGSFKYSGPITKIMVAQTAFVFLERQGKEMPKLLQVIR